MAKPAKTQGGGKSRTRAAGANGAKDPATAVDVAPPPVHPPAADTPPGTTLELNDLERGLLADLLAVIAEHDEAGHDRSRPGPARVRVRLRAPRRPAPQVGRGLHRAPGRRGQDLRGHAAGHRDAVRGAPARHGRGHHRVAGRGPRRVRRGGRHARGRRHQAHRHHLPEPRRAAGRELPQDDRRDGHGHPRRPDQARRPPAQHAHARGDAQAEAAGQGQGDARDLRAAGPPARHPRDQVGAGGPGLRHAPPAQVQGDQGPRQPAARGARGLRGARRQLPGQGARGGRHRRRDLGPRQALLLDLLEDDQEGPRVQRDLRPHGDAGPRRLGQGLLRRDRGHPLALEAAARALQGLGRRCPSSTCTRRSTPR